MTSKLLCASALLLSLGGCAGGVDGDRRELAQDLVEGIRTPDGFETVGAVSLRDPELGQSSPQLGSAFLNWVPTTSDTNTSAVLSSFSLALSEAGFIPREKSRCDLDELVVLYWHVDTGPARLSFTQDQEMDVRFTAFWDNDAPTVAEQEADIPACP